jgi:Flp pilus assembly protein TadG
MGVRRRDRADRGAAVVELALVLPVLAMLLFGIVEFGRGYSAQVELTSAVREGARAAALKTGDPVTVVKGAAGSLDPAKITVTPGPACLPGADAVVTATYPFTYEVPFFGSRTATLDAKAVMRCGG